MLDTSTTHASDHAPVEGPVPLSENEQRLLEQMERALHAEDPKFATTMSGADLRSHYRRRALLASVAFVLGVVVLMTGAVSEIIPLGVAGFVVMLTAAWFAVTSWRRMPGPGEIGTFGPPASTGRTKRGRQGGGFMDRVEERWRRRREQGPGR
jgi:Protein of unknown function (DUF3040)